MGEGGLRAYRLVVIRCAVCARMSQRVAWTSTREGAQTAQRVTVLLYLDGTHRWWGASNTHLLSPCQPLPFIPTAARSRCAAPLRAPRLVARAGCLPVTDPSTARNQSTTGCDGHSAWHRAPGAESRGGAENRHARRMDTCARGCTQGAGAARLCRCKRAVSRRCL